MSLLVFACFAPSSFADFVNYPADPVEDFELIDSDIPSTFAFDSPSVLTYRYYPDKVGRPTMYVEGRSFWGLSGTNSWEHTQHFGSDYVSWATYRVNYSVKLKDDYDDNTPFYLDRFYLKFNAPMSGTEVRVSGYSDNISLDIDGVSSDSTSLTMEAFPRNTLLFPADETLRFSFYIDFTIMFDPSIPVSDLVDLSDSNSPVVPVMDASGFSANVKAYLPAMAEGSSSAAGQQQIDQSINTQGDKVNQSINQQIQQQQNQYNEFTGGGGDSAFVTVENSLGETMGLFDAVDSIYTNIWGIFHENPGYAIVTFPSFSINVDGVPYEVWPEYTFDFNTLNNEWGLGPLKVAVNFACVFAVYAGLLRYLTLVYETIIGRFHIYAGNYF